MKNSLTILLLLLSIITIGQTVPNTTTFTLQNVVDAVNPTTDDLQDCFNDANSLYYNTSYYNSYYSAAGNKFNLLMFRDYGSHNYTTGVQYTNNGGLAYSSGASIDVPYPAGTGTGDGLILAFKIYAGDVAVGSPPATPSGWTYLGHGTDVGYDFYYAYYYRIPTTSLSGSVTLTHTFSSPIDFNGIIYRYTNVSGADASNATVTSFYTTSYEVNPTPPTDYLGIVISIDFTDNTVTVSGDYGTDVQVIDGVSLTTFTATSGIGDNTEKSVIISGGARHGVLWDFNFIPFL